MAKLTVKTLQSFLGVIPDGQFGLVSKAALLTRFTNMNARALTPADVQVLALRLGVHPSVIYAIREVEAPRGAFDTAGRPTILFEKHIFGKQTDHKYNNSHPDLSSSKWMPGTYGPASNQWNRLATACSLDPHAAFEAASFGAFQVLGCNAEDIGYQSAFHMALELTRSELAHMECFEKFINSKGLADELRGCKGGSPTSCIPLVRAYNGTGYARNNYHINLSKAILKYARV